VKEQFGDNVSSETGLLHVKLRIAEEENSKIEIAIRIKAQKALNLFGSKNVRKVKVVRL
jgi:hypothetical protein